LPGCTVHFVWLKAWKDYAPVLLKNLHQNSVNGFGLKANVENHIHFIFMIAYPSDNNNKCTPEIKEANPSLLLCNYFYYNNHPPIKILNSGLPERS